MASETVATEAGGGVVETAVDSTSEASWTLASSAEAMAASESEAGAVVGSRTADGSDSGTEED
jgi:hypothetical protein